LNRQPLSTGEALPPNVIRIGPSGSTTQARSTLEAIDVVAGMGLTALEVNYVRGARASEETTRRVGARAEELGVALSAHAPYYVSLNSQRDEVRASSVGHIVETARRCHWLGAPFFAVHGGTYGGLESAEATDGVVDRILQVQTRMEADGIIGVKVGLETTGRPSAWGTLEEIEAVADQVDVVLPVVDFSHVHARTGGALRTEEDFRNLVEWALDVSDCQLYCHFQSIEYGDKGEVRHLPVDSYDPDFRLLAPVLLDLECDVHLICESPLLEKDAILLKGILEGEVG
jgi:deoxyribonuclease-4